jgi:hypothetical protein
LLRARAFEFFPFRALGIECTIAMGLPTTPTNRSSISSHRIDSEAIKISN